MPNVTDLTSVTPPGGSTFLRCHCLAVFCVTRFLSPLVTEDRASANSAGNGGFQAASTVASSYEPTSPFSPPAMQTTSFSCVGQSRKNEGTLIFKVHVRSFTVSRRRGGHCQ